MKAKETRSRNAALQAKLGRLRQLIERVSDTEAGRSAGSVSSGWPALDGFLGRDDARAVEGRGDPDAGLALGVLHEWLGIAPSKEALRPSASTPREHRRMASSFGTLDWQPPLFLFSHLACRALERRQAENRTGVVLWIGKRVWPYPHTLVQTARPKQTSSTELSVIDAIRSFELELVRRLPRAALVDEREDLLSHSMFIDPRHDRAKLWAIDVALRSKAVAAVVADGSRLPIASTRRLQLAARAGEALCLLARPPWEIRELTCATTRFLVRRSIAGPDDLRWTVDLMRAKSVRPELAS